MMTMSAFQRLAFMIGSNILFIKQYTQSGNGEHSVTLLRLNSQKRMVTQS
jgi:hypothetical protein